MRPRQSNPFRRLTAAFTLIELLVVIAIIAILTAILLPVFATVRENARASSSMSNMHQISTALAQFQLDQHTYPDVLFGYAYPTTPGASTYVPMDRAYDQAAAAKVADMYFPGLYPEYVKDYRVFTDPNNSPIQFGDVKPAKVNFLCPSAEVACADPTSAANQGDNGKLKQASKTFYTADAYDISPAITGANAVSTSVYVPRYQRSWTSVDANLDCTGTGATKICGDKNENLYTHQLHWKNPPAQTYVTSTTYHVPQTGKVLVLWQNGSVRKVNVSDFLKFSGSATSESGQTDLSVNSSGVSQANFWKLDPTGP